MEDAFGIIEKIYAVDKDAPGKIASQMLRAVNIRCVNTDRNRNDTLSERMAIFMHGAEDMKTLRRYFTAASLSRKEGAQTDIHDLIAGTARYLERNPEIGRHVPLTPKEHSLLRNISAPYRSDYTCNL